MDDVASCLMQTIDCDTSIAVPRNPSTTHHDGHVQVHKDEVKAVDATSSCNQVDSYLSVLSYDYIGVAPPPQDSESHLQ